MNSRGVRGTSINRLHLRRSLAWAVLYPHIQMISTEKVSLSYGSQRLFEDVTVKFVPGNCYGLIGANGAGKSTFLKILAGQIPPDSGTVSITPGERLAFLRQDQFAFEDEQVLKTVI